MYNLGMSIWCAKGSEKTETETIVFNPVLGSPFPSKSVLSSVRARFETKHIFKEHTYLYNQTGTNWNWGIVSGSRFFISWFFSSRFGS